VALRALRFSKGYVERDKKTHDVYLLPIPIGIDLPALVFAIWGRVVAVVGARDEVKGEHRAAGAGASCGVGEHSMQVVVLAHQTRVLCLQLADLGQRRGQHRRLLERDLAQCRLQLRHHLFQLRNA
jgi:hypothetical protein